MGGHASPTTQPTRGPPVEAECVVDDRVFAGICEPHIPEYGRRRTDGERHRRWRWCLRKNTWRKATGNHHPTFPKNMDSQIRNNANDVNGIFSSAGYVASGNGGDEASGVVVQRNPHISGDWRLFRCGYGERWKRSVE